MKVNKGDLVIVSNGQKTSTCVVLSAVFTVSFPDVKNYYYSLCIETGIYGVIYDNEVISVVCEDFAPEIDFANELFETDYSYYADVYDSFSYFPAIWGMCPHDPDNSDDSDE